MRRTVLSNEPRPIHREYHRQVLNCHVVNDAVICALEKRRVNGAHGANSLGSESGGKGHSVSLRNPDIEKAIRKGLGERASSGATRHCAGDRHDLRILLRQIDEPLTERGSVGRIRDRSLTLLAGGRIVTRRERMPLLDVLSSRKSLPFLGDAVNQTRAAQVPHGSERVHQHIDVVAIDGTEIAKPQLLEKHSRSEKRLHALFPLSHQSRHSGEGTGCGVDNAANRGTNAIVERVALDRGEILRHRTNVRSDRHLVVIQDDDEIALGGAGVVQTFVRQTARERAITEDGYDLEILAVQIARNRHPIASGNCGARVAGTKRVVFALAALQEPGQAVLLT